MDVLPHSEKAMLPLLLGAVVLVSCSHFHAREMPSSHQQSEDIRSILKSVVLTDLHFADEDIRDVVEYITQECRQLGPQGAGVRLVLMLEPGAKPSEAENPFASPATDAPRVSLDVEETTLYDLLERICRQTDLRWSIRERSVLIADKSYLIE